MDWRTFLTKRWKSAAAGAGLAIGAAIFMPGVGDELAMASFDLSFKTRPESKITNVVVIFMDKDSSEKLNQPWTGAPWRRSIHASLVRRLVQCGARAIVFDVLFSDSEKEDPDFIQAIKEARQLNIPVIVGIVYDYINLAKSDVQVDVTTPVDPFADLKAVADWGVAEATPDRSDRPRRHYVRDETPSLTVRTAQLVQPDAVRNLPTERWINFYGPPESLPNLSYWRALKPGVLPDSTFSNKVCFVGALARSQVPVQGGKSTDEWHTPHTRLGAGKMAGVELIATVYLNLVRRDWLNQISVPGELALILATGIVLGAGLVFFRPAAAFVAGLAAAVLIAAIASWLMWHRLFWFNWLIPAVVQMPVAVVWAIHTHTRRLARANQSLQERLERQSAQEPAGTTRLAPNPGADGGNVPAAAGERGGCLEIPDHTLLRCVGKGAYGEVWLARNIFGSCHVVKVIRRQSFEQAEPFDREFRGIQKFMPVSRLHPGLVQVLQAGRNEEAGYFYYVMEPADDESSGQQIRADAYAPRSLATDLRRLGRLAPDDCVKLGLRLAEALAFLHAQGLIHRDLKPANIIFVRGEPKLADIGLVTDIANTSHDVSLVGTPGYIPPEGPGQPSADVFSLGRVLYESAMGLPRSKFPELPEDIVTWPQHDLLLRLNQVIMRACDNELTERYSSATELCADLQALSSSKAPATP